MSLNANQKGGVIWIISDKLRDGYKPHDGREDILTMMGIWLFSHGDTMEQVMKNTGVVLHEHLQKKNDEKDGDSNGK